MRALSQSKWHPRYKVFTVSCAITISKDFLTTLTGSKSMLCDILPLWAVEFWEAHGKPWQTPQTCHVFEDLRLCGIKRTPLLPAEKSENSQTENSETSQKEMSTEEHMLNIANSSVYCLYLSLFCLTFVTSQGVLGLICRCCSSIQCCNANL